MPIKKNLYKKYILYLKKSCGNKKYEEKSWKVYCVKCYLFWTIKTNIFIDKINEKIKENEWNKYIYKLFQKKKY